MGMNMMDMMMMCYAHDGHNAAHVTRCSATTAYRHAFRLTSRLGA